MSGSGGGTDLWRFVRERDSAWKRERVLVAVLNARQKLLGVAEVSPKDLTAARLRKAFKDVPLRRAATLVCVHHRPGAHRQPSRSEAALTEQLEEVAHELGVQYLDHAIFSGGHYRASARRRRR